VDHPENETSTSWLTAVNVDQNWMATETVKAETWKDFQVVTPIQSKT